MNESINASAPSVPVWKKADLRVSTFESHITNHHLLHDTPTDWFLFFSKSANITAIKGNSPFIYFYISNRVAFLAHTCLHLLRISHLCFCVLGLDEYRRMNEDHTLDVSQAERKEKALCFLAATRSSSENHWTTWSLSQAGSKKVMQIYCFCLNIDA